MVASAKNPVRFGILALLVGAGLLAFRPPAAPVGAIDPSLDSDGDGLTDAMELTVYHTDPLNPDTDGDGHPDGLEVSLGFSPRHGGGMRLVDVDSDSDYLNDAWEILLGTDLLNPDTDGDGYLDGTEVAAAYDPLDPAPVRVDKRIEVSLSGQTLSYYWNDVLLEGFSVSTGLPGTPTPVGEFAVLDKVPVKRYVGPGYDLPNTRWNLLFHRTGADGGNYYIHGAYWHDSWGKPMSHGCVNVPYSRMERLYFFAQHGTPVRIRP